MPLWEWLYRHYFWVTSDGWQHVPNQDNVLFVGSHNGGLAAPDMHMAIYDWYRHYGTERLIYGLAHPKVWAAFPPLAQGMAKVGAIRAHPKMAIAALNQGASVLVYPGGAQDTFRPHRHRHRIELANRKGFIKLALRQKVPIMPVISWGAHDTLWVLSDIYEQAKQLHQRGIPWPLGIDPEVFPIYFGLPWGLSIGPLPNLPLPAPIHLRICPPIWFEHYGRKCLNDLAYVDECYAMVETQMQLALDGLVCEIEG
ncbi:MAG: lysophospholipid acyltransferase family protein [Cyanobacteria bacterium P01_A01_bin.123]